MVVPDVPDMLVTPHVSEVAAHRAALTTGTVTVATVTENCFIGTDVRAVRQVRT